MKKYWHVCTEGLKQGVIFKERKDFVFGMNGIPVCALKHRILVLAFCLMDNHVHFIVAGEEQDCRKFVFSYRRRLSVLADMEGVDVCIKAIGDMEYLRMAIGYVLRNPMDAGGKELPFYYEWGSGALYFRGDVSVPFRSWNSQSVADMGPKKMRVLLKSNFILPDYYMVSPEGVVLPENYVRADIVERVFGLPVRFIYSVLRNDAVEMELAGEVLRKVRYTDSELAGSVIGLCRQKFRAESPESLAMEDRCRLAGLLRKRYGIGVKQISRLTGVNPELLSRIFGH